MGENRRERIIRSPYPDIDTVTGKTIPEFIWERLDQNPHWKQADCLVCWNTGKKYTYEEVFKLSKGFAAGLKSKLKLDSGEVVGIVLPNCPQFVISLLGVLEAGLIVSTMNPLYKSVELEHLIKSADIKCIVTMESFMPTILLLQEEYPELNLKQIISIDGSGGSDKIFSYEELVLETFHDIKFLKGTEIDTTKQTAIIPFSSGTTGLPKGVMLTHSNICTNVQQVNLGTKSAFKIYSKNGTQEQILGVLPFFHSYSLSFVLLLSLYNGSKLTTVQKFNPTTFTLASKEIKPTLWYLVPPLITFIVNSPAFSSIDFEFTHSVISGAAPLGQNTITKFVKKIGKPVQFIEGYGLTELSPATHLNDSSSNSKMGSIGVLLSSTLAKIVDVQTGLDLGPNEPGEMWIKGPQMMKGYCNNEQATREMIDENGWLHTGDVSKYDVDGYFWVVDRLKEIIKVKGFQVSPSELENILKLHPKVADVAVIGVPKDEENERPRAYIIRKDDSVTDLDLHEFLNKQVSAFKRLEGGIEFVENIPRSTAGKTLRKELLKLYLKLE